MIAKSRCLTELLSIGDFFKAEKQTRLYTILVFFSLDKILHMYLSLLIRRKPSLFNNEILAGWVLWCYWDFVVKWLKSLKKKISFFLTQEIQ
jgi:hypothetical protein